MLLTRTLVICMKFSFSADEGIQRIVINHPESIKYRNFNQFAYP